MIDGAARPAADARRRREMRDAGRREDDLRWARGIVFVRSAEAGGDPGSRPSCAASAKKYPQPVAGRYVCDRLTIIAKDDLVVPERPHCGIREFLRFGEAGILFRRCSRRGLTPERESAFYGVKGWPAGRRRPRLAAVAGRRADEEGHLPPLQGKTGVGASASRASSEIT